MDVAVVPVAGSAGVGASTFTLEDITSLLRCHQKELRCTLQGHIAEELRALSQAALSEPAKAEVDGDDSFNIFQTVSPAWQEQHVKVHPEKILEKQDEALVTDFSFTSAVPEPSPSSPKIAGLSRSPSVLRTTSESSSGRQFVGRKSSASSISSRTIRGRSMAASRQIHAITNDPDVTSAGQGDKEVEAVDPDSPALAVCVKDASGKLDALRTHTKSLTDLSNTKKDGKECGNKLESTILMTSKSQAPSKANAGLRRVSTFTATLTRRPTAALQQQMEKISGLLNVADGPRWYNPHSALMRFMVSIVILANAVYIGAKAEYDLWLQVANPQGTADDGEHWDWVERAFSSVFLIELSARIYVDRCGFLFGQDWNWNLFDLVLVGQSLFGMALELTSSANSPNFSFSRTLRILRFARILRIIRVIRFLDSLRVMIYSILHSIVNLLWVFLLLLFVIYFFAIIFVHGVTEHLSAKSGAVHHLPYHDSLRKDYGSVRHALVSLFMSICGGKDWYELYYPLNDIHPAYGFIFLVYIFFIVFGVLNVVTSVFVDNAHQVSQRDRDIVTQHEIQRHLDYAKDIRNFFVEADKDNSGMLSWEEFHEHLQDPKVQAYFATLQLDVAQAHALFLLLDVDETNEVDIDEFVGGCMRLKGDAKSIDVNMLLYENEKMICTFTKFIEYAEEKFEGIDEALGIHKHSAHQHNAHQSSTTPPRRFSRLHNARKSLLGGAVSFEPDGALQLLHAPPGPTLKRRPSSIFQVGAQALRDFVHQSPAEPAPLSPMPAYGRLERGVEALKTFKGRRISEHSEDGGDDECEPESAHESSASEAGHNSIAAAAHEAGHRHMEKDVNAITVIRPVSEREKGCDSDDGLKPSPSEGVHNSDAAAATASETPPRLHVEDV